MNIVINKTGHVVGATSWCGIFCKVQKLYSMQELVCFSTCIIYQYMEIFVFLEVAGRGVIALLALP